MIALKFKSQQKNLSNQDFGKKNLGITRRGEKKKKESNY